MTSSFSSVWKGFRLLMGRTRTLNMLYVLCALLVSFQLLISTQTHPKEGWPTLYNNYVIFKMSFTHLLQGVNLYLSYPSSYYDLYKYSPAFAVMMAPFSLMPDYLGLPLWNLLNALVLLWGVRKLSGLQPIKQNLLLLFLLPELIISLQNSQSNALVAGLMLLSLSLLRERKVPLATLLLAMGTMIKIFPAAGFLLLLLFPRFLQSAAWSAVWLFVLFLLPLPFSGFSQFTQVYANWLELLRADHTASTGLSIYAWLEAWFGSMPDKNLLLLAGTAFLLLGFLLPRFRPSFKKDPADYLALVMIWIVIFNHKAESPTFIIAMAGCGLWYFNHPANWGKTALIIIALILVSLSPTDLVPASWKDGWLHNGVWKAFPCILFWALISFDLIFRPLLKSPAKQPIDGLRKS